MAEFTNNIVRIEDRQTILGKNVLNVYHFFLPLTLSTVNLSALVDQFQSAYVDQIALAQTDAVIHNEIYAKMLNFGVLEFTKSIAVAGNRSATEFMPSYAAVSYRLQRTVTDIRNGRKSIGGVAEVDTAGNNLTGAAIAIWSALESVLDTNLTTPDGVWEHIILGEQNATNPDTYNLSSISGVVMETNVSSQVSRKVLT